MNPQRYENWNSVDWTQVQSGIFKLQKRIFRASERGDIAQVRNLQKLLLKSFFAKLLSVRLVSQINLGKNTAGIDGVKKLSDEEKWKLAKNLDINYSASPTKRVWIDRERGSRLESISNRGVDKPGRKEKRPLGIPVMQDRARQALVKLALEPEWEAKFEENSYGFRKGRSCHDAIAMIYISLRNPKYCLDADIAGCFDNINHQALLEKLNTTPLIRRQVKAWLKSGVMDDKTFLKTTQGTPQGGILSPLLANIALHGMENFIKDKILEEFPRQYTTTGKRLAKVAARRTLCVIRYADDFVIMHNQLEVVQRAQELIRSWLENMGLQLKDSKTKIIHTLKEHDQQQPGFDFLGFNIRHYPVGIHNSNKYGNHKLLIKPSKDKIMAHYHKIKQIVHKSYNLSAKALIGKLNPIIRGWANYYQYVVSSQVFRDLDDKLYNLQWIWSKKKHPKKGVKSLKLKYFISKDATWRLSYLENDKRYYLCTYRSVKVNQRFVKVKGTKSPYDGDWAYWSERMAQYPGIDPLTSGLIKKQKGKCPECGKYITQEDHIQRDHTIPVALGGNRDKSNLQVIHYHCHLKKTQIDLKAIHRNRSEGKPIRTTLDRKKRYRNNYVFQ